MQQVQQQQIISDFNNKVKTLFGNLIFKKESHEYFIDKAKIPISVSGIVKSFVPFTDWDAIATAIGKREGVSKEEILKRWKDKNEKACTSGTKTHDFAENLTKESIAENEKEQAVILFWEDLNKQNPGRYILIAKEVRMYHKIYNYSGTCDIILFDTFLNGFIIGDYKTNEDLFKNYKEQTLNSPFEFLLDCPYNHYQIQLSLYEILLEQLNLSIFERWIIYLRNDGTYDIHKTYDFSPILKSQVFEKREQSLELNMSI